MIAFITSLRARALAQDWDYHVWLLERTVTSMLAQSRGECCAVIACHEEPETAVGRDPRVHCLSVTFPPPARDNDDMCADKVLKLSVGTEWALAHGCDYVVFNDADDLVSNRIGGFVTDHNGAAGWFAPSQMFYTYGGRMLRHCEIPAPSAGPCVIVRANLLTFDLPPFSGAWADLVGKGGETRFLEVLGRHRRQVNVLAAVGLGHYREFMTNEGHPLDPLPFSANIVINHSDSTSHVAGGIGSYDRGVSRGHPAWRRFLSQTKQRALKLPTLRAMTQSLRREYGIPPDHEIPLGYRIGGSIFWR